MMIVAAAMFLFGDTTVLQAQETETSVVATDEATQEQVQTVAEDAQSEDAVSYVTVNGQPLSPEDQRIVLAAVAGVFLVTMFLTVVSIASMWAVFTKAGKPGWAAIVPVYQVIVLLEVAGKPVWWLLLLMVPIVNIGVALIVMIEVAKNFGKGPVFGVGLLLFSFLFFPILGFGKAKYLGPQIA